MPRRCTAREHLDDDHAAAAAWTSGLAGIDGGSGGPALRLCNSEQLTGACDVAGASAFGEQAVVADAVEAAWQHVDEEAADEFVGGERHALVAIAALDAVVLPLEGDAALVAGDQAAVGDGDAVGVTRQIGQYRFRAAERTLCVDDPLDLAQRREISREGLRLGDMGVIPEEAQAAGLMRGDELLQEQSPEQAGEHTHREEESGPAGHPTLTVQRDAPPGTIMCTWG